MGIRTTHMVYRTNALQHARNIFITLSNRAQGVHGILGNVLGYEEKLPPADADEYRELARGVEQLSDNELELILDRFSDSKFENYIIVPDNYEEEEFDFVRNFDPNSYDYDGVRFHGHVGRK